MLWEVDVTPVGQGQTGELTRIAEEYNLLTHTMLGNRLLAAFQRGYLLEGELSHAQANRLTNQLLVDDIVETVRVGALNEHLRSPLPAAGGEPGVRVPMTLTILLRPGVMDPVAQSVVEAARDLTVPVRSVRTFRRYVLAPDCPSDARLDVLYRKVLANEAVEQVVEGRLNLDHLSLGAPYHFRLITVPLRDLDDNALEKLSRAGQLSLSRAEMRTIQAHFRDLGRNPTDVELETIAQTWSEHCSHKTLKGRVEFTGPDGTRTYENLLKETIFHATQEIRWRLGTDDWCVSVFEDNAGVIRFDDRHHVCFKVETHNHPSAIEPYGGANTGLGGVIRDVLGTGLGGKPVCNTDVFCFAPPSYPPEKLPPAVLHPRRVMTGVVAGVRDYGNRMGIPTVNGAICFDDRYLANPLVFCGTVGTIPVDRARKEARPGDLIVAVGGRTGRDGIHGATFSSAELTHESEQTSGGAVQIGNAITEKKMLDVLLTARDHGLYHAITDCGAGGFSSAVGEMGEHIGAEVHLEKAPLKYEGLSYTEIWISESQERMVLAVSPQNWPALKTLCESEDVEATVIGEYQPTGRLRLFYDGNQVADLAMEFLHGGRPEVARMAVWGSTSRDRKGAEERTIHPPLPHGRGSQYTEILLRILSSLNVCSKEWVIRQYDHEVQGSSVIKPLVGVANDGPGDAAVITPVPGSNRGLAIGCGINPRYGDLDPYWMAASAIDEAVRNVVAVGADPSRIAILDNFCWGNTDRPEVLGSLVRAAEACRDTAIAYGTPFISGKDSLNNEFHSGDVHITIPPTLLISALGIVPDIRRCVTMDLKRPDNLLCLIGETKPEMGGSHFGLVNGLNAGEVPRVNFELAPILFRKLHEAIRDGLIVSCHDLSEGGLAVALAEMCFAGGLSADVSLSDFDLPAPEVVLFSESNTRFVVEIAPASRLQFERLFDELPWTLLGEVTDSGRLRVSDLSQALEKFPLIDVSIVELKSAWQQPLKW